MKHILILFLALLAALSSLLVWKLNVLSSNHLPHYSIDVSIDKVSYKRYNAQGALTLTLNAPKLTHNSSTRRVTIESPHIVNHTNKADTWEIWADKAESDEHYRSIFLKGHVKMKEISAHSKAPITLTTSEITLTPKKNAITHSNVVATQGLSSLKAEGAKLDFKTNTLQLLGKTDLIEKPNPSH